jgi:hypothetical protein
MSSFLEFASWFVLVVGTWATVRNGRLLLSRRAARAKHEVTEPASRKPAWHDFRFSLLTVILGVYFVADLWNYNIARWPLGTYASILLIGELGSWFTRRRQRKSSGQAAGQS